jgi:hypothetical protein
MVILALTTVTLPLASNTLSTTASTLALSVSGARMNGLRAVTAPQFYLLATSAVISGVCMPSLSKLHVPFSRISWAKRLVPVIAAFIKPEP